MVFKVNLLIDTRYRRLGGKESQATIFVELSYAIYIQT